MVSHPFFSYHLHGNIFIHLISRHSSTSTTHCDPNECSLSRAHSWCARNLLNFISSFLFFFILCLLCSVPISIIYLVHVACRAKRFTRLNRDELYSEPVYERKLRLRFNFIWVKPSKADRSMHLMNAGSKKKQNRKSNLKHKTT